MLERSLRPDCVPEYGPKDGRLYSGKLAPIDRRSQPNLEPHGVPEKTLRGYARGAKAFGLNQKINAALHKGRRIIDRKRKKLTFSE